MQVSSFPNTIRRAGRIDVDDEANNYYVQKRAARNASGVTTATTAFRPKSSYDGLFDRQPTSKKPLDSVLPDKLPSSIVKRNQSYTNTRSEHDSDSDHDVDPRSKQQSQNNTHVKSKPIIKSRQLLTSSQSFTTPATQERTSYYIDELPSRPPSERMTPGNTTAAAADPPEPKPRSRTSKSFAVYNRADTMSQDSWQRMQQRQKRTITTAAGPSNPFLVQSVDFSNEINKRAGTSGMNDNSSSYAAFNTMAPDWSEDNNVEQSVVVVDPYSRPFTDSYYESPKNDLSHPYFDLLLRHQKQIVKFVDKIAPPSSDTMIRSRVYVSKGMFNEYMMHIEGIAGPSDTYPVLVTKRKKKYTNLFYYVNVIDPAKSSSIKFGRLTANFTRSKYMLIGNLKPNSQSLDDETSIVGGAESTYFEADTSDSGGLIRKYFELEYFNKVFGQARPKDIQMDLSVRDENEEEEDADYVSVGRVGSSVSRLRRGESIDSSSTTHRRRRVNKHIKLATKRPMFDAHTRTFRSDFEGRARLPSTNNVQVALESDPDRVVWQLGKWDSKCFNVDYSYPFSAFSAFSLAISCLSRN